MTGIFNSGRSVFNISYQGDIVTVTPHQTFSQRIADRLLSLFKKSSRQPEKLTVKNPNIANVSDYDPKVIQTLFNDCCRTIQERMNSSNEPLAKVVNEVIQEVFSSITIMGKMFSDGTKLEGLFKNGRLFEGKITTPDGAIYETLKGGRFIWWWPIPVSGAQSEQKEPCWLIEGPGKVSFTDGRVVEAVFNKTNSPTQ